MRADALDVGNGPSWAVAAPPGIRAGPSEGAAGHAAGKCTGAAAANATHMSVKQSRAGAYVSRRAAGHWYCRQRALQYR